MFHQYWTPANVFFGRRHKGKRKTNYNKSKINNYRWTSFSILSYFIYLGTSLCTVPSHLSTLFLSSQQKYWLHFHTIWSNYKFNLRKKYKVSCWEIKWFFCAYFSMPGNPLDGTQLNYCKKRGVGDVVVVYFCRSCSTCDLQLSPHQSRLRAIWNIFLCLFEIVGSFTVSRKHESVRINT